MAWKSGIHSSRVVKNSLMAASLSIISRMGSRAVLSYVLAGTAIFGRLWFEEPVPVWPAAGFAEPPPGPSASLLVSLSSSSAAAAKELGCRQHHPRSCLLLIRVNRHADDLDGAGRRTDVIPAYPLTPVQPWTVLVEMMVMMMTRTMTL